MEEGLMTMEQLIQQQNQSNAAGASRKLEEYDDVITGLWDILQSDVAASPKPAFQEDEDSLPPTPRTPFIESFSLQAFNSRVQNLFDRAQAAKEQQEILRRQIQQQRELNEKGDAERDAHIADLTTKHDALTQEHGVVQQELANYIVKHEATENEASQSRNELMNVMAELEEMKKTMDAKTAEREEVDKKLREQMEVMSKQISDSEELESEVARLKMELVQAQADLDGAYGSREQRKGAQAGQVAQLERELSEMTAEFQELTKESIELEKEREQLDALIDGLRDRCDSLEAQLSDERLRWVGIRSPGLPNGGDVREGTSMMVLRQEFKKMMREQRAEAMKMLRVSARYSDICGVGGVNWMLMCVLDRTGRTTQTRSRTAQVSTSERPSCETSAEC
jgi:DNA repair exonuclease SbcCD ATPase subunit